MGPSDSNRDTDSACDGDPVAAFQERIRRGIAQLDLAAQARFRGELRIRRAGSVCIVEITSTPADYLRSAGSIQDGNSDLFVVLCRAGRASANQRELEIPLAPGDGVVLDNAKEWHLRVLAEAVCWALQMPKSQVRRLVPGVDNAGGTKLHGASPALGLLYGYLTGTLADDLDDERAAALFGDHLVDLTAFALHSTGEVPRLVEAAGARGAYLAKVLHEIESQSAEPRLNAALIAVQLGVTPRYIHRVLEQTGRSFSQHVLEKRLDAAARLLGDANLRTHKIAQIALDVGFTDLSHFNRAFRWRFGTTPSSFRARAMRHLTSG